MSTYSAEYTCGRCKREQSVPLTKRVAAFYDVLAEPFRCEACQGSEAASSSHTIPEADDELIAEWLSDDGLMFMMQDEELILASAPLDVLTRGYEGARNRRRKQQIAISVAIRLHDGICVTDEEQQAAAAWLRRHQAVWIDYFDYQYVSRDIAKRLGVT